MTDHVSVNSNLIPVGSVLIVLPDRTWDEALALFDHPDYLPLDGREVNRNDYPELCTMLDDFENAWRSHVAASTGFNIPKLIIDDTKKTLPDMRNMDGENTPLRVIRCR